MSSFYLSREKHFRSNIQEITLDILMRLTKNTYSNRCKKAKTHSLIKLDVDAAVTQPSIILPGEKPSSLHTQHGVGVLHPGSTSRQHFSSHQSTSIKQEAKANEYLVSSRESSHPSKHTSSTISSLSANFTFYDLDQEWMESLGSDEE